MIKILLIEDNEMTQDMLARYLKLEGYHTVIAKDGTQGIAMAVSEQPDIILMDMSLPILDGWEATRQLKARPETCAIPIIALTAHAMAEDRTRSLDAGCDDYESKPVEFNQLIAKIQILLTKRTV